MLHLGVVYVETQIMHYVPHGVGIYVSFSIFDFWFSIFSDSNGFCGLKRNGTQMTQIDMIDMI